MIELAPFFDDDGNVNLHAREGAIAEFSFADADGVDVDASSWNVFFDVSGFRKQLTPHATDPTLLVLTIERGDLNQYLNKLTDYVIVDETDAIPIVIIEGKVRVRGWI
jgi:hypothetical protein